MRSFDANGETWEVTLDAVSPHPGVSAVVFHCVSNEQQGWRVAEVPADRIGSPDALDELDPEELERLFTRSDAFDFVHDPGAGPHHPVEEVPPRGAES